MRTSELHKGQPILAFLAPSGANAAPLSQPTKRPFHDPSSCWMLLLFRCWLWQGFAATPSVSDMFLIIEFGNKAVDIIEIIPFIQTKMLFFCRTWDHNGEDQVINRPFVVLVSPSKVHRQWGASRSVGLRPVASPPRGAGTDLLSIACHFQRIRRCRL